MTDIQSIQKALSSARIDAWLFCDFLHRDSIAYRILGLGEGLAKRRWFYAIPARGNPRKLVHRIEAGMLDALPGAKLSYSSRRELETGLARLLDGFGLVAMQYSPLAENPYVGTVDAGTIELVRSCGVKVASSADLVQQFEACWDEEQLQSHLAAGKAIDRIVRAAFDRAADFLRGGRRVTEYDLQQWMWARFGESGVVSDSPPIVAAGVHSGNPHYEPAARRSAVIRRGEVLLLDVWGKIQAPESVYYDVTWTGFTSERIPPRVARIFGAVSQARDAAIQFVQRSAAAGRSVQGWQVDRACRSVIEKAGYGEQFTHRTGHNIGREVHGNGANIDGLEMHDTRRLIPGTCFSVEPGIYLSDFGIRSEVDVYMESRAARVTSPVQREMIPLLAARPSQRKGNRRASIQ